MQRMHALDAAFLDAEDEDPNVSMAIASIAVFDGPAPSDDELIAAYEAKLPLVPRYRQRVIRPLLDLAAPVWVDDPDFDIGYHIRRTALPRPGDAAALRRLMSRVMAQRLDRDRPLWECWVVEGLDDGRWALISKVHHCMGDGVSGTELYHLLLSTTSDVEPLVSPQQWCPNAPPSVLQVTAAGAWSLASSPTRHLQVFARLLRHPTTTAARVATTVRGLRAMAGVLRPAPSSSLLGAIGRQRFYVAETVSLTQVKRIAHHYGVTVNDVALAAATAGLRAVLATEGDALTPHSVRTLVPVSVRAPGEEGIPENRVSCLLAELPVDVVDPVQRLKNVHRELQRLKDTHEAEAGEALVAPADHEPFVLVSPLLRAMFRLPQRAVVTVTTNVPGPREPLFLLGRRMVHLLPYVPIAAGVRLGTAILSYCDEISFGVTADLAMASDADLLAQRMRQEIQTLLESVAAEQVAV
jgi:WS/DGAT/MGAT family acyltransferase